MAREELSKHTWIPRIIARTEEDLIKLVLKGKVLSVGEIVAVRGISTDLPVLYEVLETDPSGFVVVADNTEVR